MQQVTEGEICWMVLRALPGPEPLAFDDKRHGKQSVRVINTGHRDEASFRVNLTNKLGSGLGKHSFSR